MPISGACMGEPLRGRATDVGVGDLAAFQEAVRHFPLVTARMLHKRREIPVAHAVFAVLALDGQQTMDLPYAERRDLLESLDLGGAFD